MTPSFARNSSRSSSFNLGMLVLPTFFQRELEEACGVPSSGEAIPIAILRDDVVGTWEVVYRCVLASNPRRSPGWEHDELALVTPATLPEPASDAARMMSELAEVILGDAAK